MPATSHHLVIQGTLDQPDAESAPDRLQITVQIEPWGKKGHMNTGATLMKFTFERGAHRGTPLGT